MRARESWDTEEDFLSLSRECVVFEPCDEPLDFSLTTRRINLALTKIHSFDEDVRAGNALWSLHERRAALDKSFAIPSRG